MSAKPSSRAAGERGGRGGKVCQKNDSATRELQSEIQWIVNSDSYLVSTPIASMGSGQLQLQPQTSVPGGSPSVARSRSCDEAPRPCFSACSDCRRRLLFIGSKKPLMLRTKAPVQSIVVKRRLDYVCNLVNRRAEVWARLVATCWQAELVWWKTRTT